MIEILDFIKSLGLEVRPGLLGTLAMSLGLFAIVVVLPFKTHAFVRKVKWLYYFQAATLVTAVVVVKSFILTSVPADIAARETIEQVGNSVLWLLGAFLINQALGLFFWEGSFFRKNGTAPPGILTGLVGVGLFVFAIYGIMTFVFDRPMTGFIVSSSIVAGVLGLAMQNSLSDLIAGVAIGIERPFKIGDWVELDDDTLGEVVDINWRATHIRSWHNSLYIVPNARISNARVHNFNRPEEAYGYWFFVHVPSTVPPTLVRRVLLEAAVESVEVLNDPAPVIRVSGAGGSYKYLVFVHFRNYPSYYIGMDDLLMHVWVQCERHGIVPSAVTSEVILRRGVAEEISEPSPREMLGQLQIFSELDEESLGTLVGGLRVHALPIGTGIVHQGDAGSTLYVISAGMVRVMLDLPDGRQEEVARLGAGEYFGEMSLLAGEPRAATVMAHTDCQLLEIDKETLRLIFDKHPELMETMARSVSERQLLNQVAEQQLSERDFASQLNALAAGLVGRMKRIFG